MTASTPPVPVVVDLLPCPFCGGTAEVEPYRIWDGYVRCRCGVTGPTRVTDREAAEAWNRRVSASPEAIGGGEGSSLRDTQPGADGAVVADLVEGWQVLIDGWRDTTDPDYWRDLGHEVRAVKSSGPPCSLKGDERHMVGADFPNGMRLTIVREDEYDAVTIWSEDGESIFTLAEVPALPALSAASTHVGASTTAGEGHE